MGYQLPKKAPADTQWTDEGREEARNIAYTRPRQLLVRHFYLLNEAALRYVMWYFTEDIGNSAPSAKEVQLRVMAEAFLTEWNEQLLSAQCAASVVFGDAPTDFFRRFGGGGGAAGAATGQA